MNHILLLSTLGPVKSLPSADSQSIQTIISAKYDAAGYVIFQTKQDLVYQPVHFQCIELVSSDTEVRTNVIYVSNFKPWQCISDNILRSLKSTRHGMTAHSPLLKSYFKSRSSYHKRYTH